MAGGLQWMRDTSSGTGQSETQFAYETGNELKEAVDKLEAKGMRGLVIDVRDNPGGLLGSVKACLWRGFSGRAGNGS